MKETQGCSKFRQFAALSIAVLGTLLSMPSANAEGMGSPSNHECFRSHLREAIDLNTERGNKYYELTDGKSLAVSQKMIFLERYALLFSRLRVDYDKEDRVYQNAGMQVICEDFVSMSKVPKFRETFANGAPKIESFKDVKTRDLRTRLESALKTGGFSGVEKEAGLWLASISGEKRLNCMMRHTLESIVRVAKLAPKHAQEARKLGLPSPEELEKKLIKDHWYFIDHIQSIDAKAAPIQASGIPIVCNDVPSLEL